MSPATAAAPDVGGLYSFNDLQQLWVQAGGSPAWAPTAAAVALAESGGDPNAADYDSNGSVDRGLWQINSVHGPLSTFDPMANAQAAVALSNNGTDWGPWTSDPIGAQVTGDTSPPSVAQLLAMLQAAGRDNGSLTAGAAAIGSGGSFTGGGVSTTSASAAAAQGGGGGLFGDVGSALGDLGSLALQGSGLSGAFSSNPITSTVESAFKDVITSFVEDELFGGMAVGEVVIRSLELLGGVLLVGTGLVLIVVTIAKSQAAKEGGSTPGRSDVPPPGAPSRNAASAQGSALPADRSTRGRARHAAPAEPRRSVRAGARSAASRARRAPRHAPRFHPTPAGR